MAIVITESGTPAPKTKTRETATFPDFLIAVGLITLVAGVAMIYRPAAVILAGLLCIFFAVGLERAKGKAGDGKKA